MTIAEQLHAEGREQGIKRGLQQGIEQGERQGIERTRREILEKLLTTRFGPLSRPVLARLQSADSETLQRWLDHFLSAPNADSVVEL
ncbi:MAG TPA: hypothetical protein VMG12_22760 [Polyangiaceae bacterium]|nr:hypothetical protein [Polyangiaceae bacterium]